MKEKRAAVYLILMMAALIYGIGFLCMVKEEDKYSYSERRLLAQRPELTIPALTEGSFTERFENYGRDQFPFREAFRRLKEGMNLKLLGRLDNNGIYTIDGQMGKLDYPLHLEQLEYALGRIDSIYEQYLKGKEMKIYLAVIPDKNYYLADNEGYPAMDYEALFSRAKEHASYATFIELREELSAEDYYRTDTHWKQEKLLPVAKKLLTSMGGAQDARYRQETATGEFLGVYAGQSALFQESEEINYLINEELEACRVTVYGEDGAVESRMYDENALGGEDAYLFFLSGTQALITIENPQADSGRELIIFRDSFAASLAPLLAEDYQKITLVDIRYINSTVLGEYLTFSGQDVLFLYSSLLLNNSLGMK
ncbi:MAG: hypothetical protein IJP31_03645 [Lachnospiraceae bacterium]|nr:hypothetical protein [Lachnospiraceae bacterium]